MQAEIYGCEIEIEIEIDIATYGINESNKIRKKMQ